MVWANTSSNPMAVTTKANGVSTKCKEKDNPTLSPINFNIQVNGNLINIMVGVYYILTILIGFLIRVSLKMVLSKVEHC